MWRRSLVKYITLSLFITLSASPGSAASKVGDGLACKKIKQVQKIQGIRYTCSKAGKKLVWIANKADLLAKADAEVKAKADAEVKAKADAEARKADELKLEKAKFLASLNITLLNKPKESDYPNQKSYIIADRRWWGWKWNLIGSFTDRAKIPASLQVTFKSPESPGFSDEIYSQYVIKCLNIRFKSKNDTWAYEPTNMNCTPIGGGLFRVNIDNLQWNVGYQFELSWELNDGSLGPVFLWAPIIPPGAYDETMNPCKDFSCIVDSYRGDSSRIPY